MGFNIVKLTDPIQFTNVAGGLVPKGAYAAGTDYAVGDSVDYNGSSYVMYVDAAAGTLPTDTTKWQVLANKGDTGETATNHALLNNLAYADSGHTGFEPAKGADDNYVTDAEKVVIGNTSGTNTGDQDLSAYQLEPSEGAFVDGDKTKLDGIEALADVTDATNVAAAGAIMDGDITGNGLVTRTGAGAYTNRTITGTSNQVTVTNGDGVSGNPTLSLPQNIDTSATPTFSSLTAGTATDVLGTALSVIRNNVAVGRIDNNASGLRVQAQNGSLQLRGTGNTGIAIDASGNAVVAGTITGANLSGTNTGDNATNSQYSGLDAAKVNKAGDTMSGDLNMGTNELIGGTGITDILKLQGTTGNGTAGSAAIQLLTGDNGATTALTVLNNGNVGIGTTSPDAKLQVQTDTNKDIRLITATHDTLTSLGSGIAFSRQSDGSYNMSGIMSWNNGGLALAGREGIAFATGGGLHYSSTIERMRITDAGNVGIGTTTPGAKLQVDTGASTTIGQIIKGAASQTADLLQIQDSSANKLMVVSSGGNVGIGVAAPATPLEVNGIVRADRTAVPAQYIQLDGGDGNNTALRAVAANKFLYIDNSDTSGTNLYNAIVFRNGTAGDTERMRVDANGNVGIGTASPNYRLEVLLPGSGTGKTISIGSVNGGSYGGLGFDANGMYLTKFDNNAGLYQNGTTGNVGIGTTSPSEKLEISGTVKATGYKSSDGSAGVSGSFTTTDGKTITIKDGLVVSIV